LDEVAAMRRRAGFTLIESLIAMVILSMAAAVLLLATESSTQAARDATEKTIAIGLAEQLLDEVLGQPYHAAGQSPTATTLGPNGYEAAGAGRARYDETGDYNGYAAQPVVDLWGVPVGHGDGAGGLRHANLRAPAGFLDRCREEVQVYYVSDSNPAVRLSAGQTSLTRAAEVRILRVNQDNSTTELVNLRRVFAYVPPTS
jgi:prepilin-type N-terminal cleavage/methylation domain-containing protein